MRFDELTAVVTGIGACLPEQALSNDDIISAGALQTDDEWIRTRTGIVGRRRARAGTSTGDLAVAAGREALRSAASVPASAPSGPAAAPLAPSGAQPAPDLLILATSTPDHPCPATAPHIAQRLGLGTIPAFDLSAVCSGFLYALITATALVRSGTCTAPLVIAADTYSTILDPHDRETAPIFGDGAAAVLLRPGPPDSPGAVLAADFGSDGSGHHLIAIPGGGSRHPRHLPQPGPRAEYFGMRGREVYAHAVRRMTQSARGALHQTGWAADGVEAFIGHQANQRILDSVAERLGIPQPRVISNIRHLGNTAAASIPLAMAEAAAAGTVPPGARTLLTAFGGGLTWASVTLTWPTATPPTRPVPPDPSPVPVHAPDAASPAPDRARSQSWTPSSSTS